ncbi:MAG: tetratricopeptide repeat protein [Nitrospinae bacterium]|nr:tetratricopeptide repeat protein [Nitrospinota bacterium]
MSYIDNTLEGMWNRFKLDFIPIWRETWSVLLLSSIFLLYLPFKLSAISYQLLAIWVLSTVFILASQRVFWMYHHIPSIHVASILSALAIYSLIRDYRLIGLICVLSILIPNLYNKINFYLLYRKDKRLPYFQNSDQFFYIPEIARYIKERTAPAEYIYVWGPFVQIYRLSDRLSCEGFLFHFVRPYTYWHTYLFDEIIGGIISKRPAYIVLIRPDFDIDVLKRITGLDYNMERVFFNRYRIYRLKGKIADSMRIKDMQQEEKLEWLESLTPGSMDYGIDNFYIKKGMYDTAIKEFKEGLTLNPNDLLMKFEFAELLKKQRQYRDAIKLFQEIAKKYDKKEWLHFEMGVSYREMGDIENALKEFEREERLYSGKADTHHQRGIIYRLQGKYEKSLTEFEQAIAINPKVEWVHHEIGVTYWNMGDIKNAVKELEIEDKSYPEKAVTLYSLYSISAENGKREYAEDGFSRMLKNNEASIGIKAGCCFHLGKIYMEGNRIHEAVKFFSRCLELLPEHKKAAEYLKQLRAMSNEQ